MLPLPGTVARSRGYRRTINSTFAYSICLPKELPFKNNWPGEMGCLRTLSGHQDVPNGGTTSGGSCCYCCYCAQASNIKHFRPSTINKNHQPAIDRQHGTFDWQRGERRRRRKWVDVIKRRTGEESAKNLWLSTTDKGTG